MIVDNVAKLLDSLPKLDKLNIRAMSFQEMCALLNTLEETSGKIEKYAAEDEMRESPNLEKDMEEESEYAEETEKKISKYHEDGTEKTKQELADERWEKRQAKLTKDTEKIKAFNDKAEAFVNKCIDYISTYTSLIISLTNIMMYVEELKRQIDNGMSELMNSPFVKEIIFWIQIIKLKIRKFLLQIKRVLAKFEMKLWQAVANGKVCGVIATAQAWLAGIAVAVEAVMMSIDSVMKMIPDMLSIAGEGMSFFITPKSMMGVNISIINAHRSIANTLSDAILISIQELVSKSKAANLGLKGAQISANVARAMSMGAVIKQMDLGIQVQVPSMENIIRKAIDIIIALLPMPDPLPKYERLNIVTNLGWLTFLMGGWCRAGQVAFGAPGYMPGLMAQKPEYSEE